MKEVAIETLKITSEAFKHNEYIPSYYTCDGENKNPPIHIDNIPEGTICLAIIVDDPDAPGGTFTHWIVWNIPTKKVIENNALTGGIEGKNDFRKYNYGGPCPPSGTHRYFFKVYALATLLHLNPDSNQKALEIAMEGRILGYGELIGLYQKMKK
jgi:Raf kinase inhibitor-like YbhB/YbcL family protein